MEIRGRQAGTYGETLWGVSPLPLAARSPWMGTGSSLALAWPGSGSGHLACAAVKAVGALMCTLMRVCERERATACTSTDADGLRGMF